MNRLNRKHLRLLSEAIELEHRRGTMVDARREQIRHIRRTNAWADAAVLWVVFAAVLALTLVGL